MEILTKNYVFVFLCLMIAALFSTEAGAEKRSSDRPDKRQPICEAAGLRSGSVENMTVTMRARSSLVWEPEDVREIVGTGVHILDLPLFGERARGSFRCLPRDPK